MPFFPLEFPSALSAALNILGRAQLPRLDPFPALSPKPHWKQPPPSTPTLPPWQGRFLLSQPGSSVLGRGGVGTSLHPLGVPRACMVPGTEQGSGWKGPEWTGTWWQLPPPGGRKSWAGWLPAAFPEQAQAGLGQTGVLMPARGMGWNTSGSALGSKAVLGLPWRSGG